MSETVLEVPDDDPEGVVKLIAGLLAQHTSKHPETEVKDLLDVFKDEYKKQARSFRRAMRRFEEGFGMTSGAAATVGLPVTTTVHVVRDLG